MFRRAGASFHFIRRNIHNQAATFKAQQRLRPSVLVTSTILAGAVLLYQMRTIQSDAEVEKVSKMSEGNGDILGKATVPSEDIVVPEPEALHGLAWGSNEYNTLMPGHPLIDVLRTPSVLQWMNNVAFRDLQLHEKHAACVDARGNVYQWGDGFFGATVPQVQKPRLTLQGKNIVKLQLTADKVYALSASGKVYALASNSARQKLKPGQPNPSSSPWWGTGWIWGDEGEEIDFVEISTRDKLGWREFITNISAGESHLIALTSLGRVLAHPVDKTANASGQLGLRHFDIPNHHIGKASQRIPVELIPLSPRSPGSYEFNSPLMSQSLVDVDDKSIHFCPNLFEVPALKDIIVSQITAGGRTSFARTPDGRVLGWGANQYGQVGLGGNLLIETVTVPTEIILWQAAPRATTKCLDVSAGGDLTAFVVERDYKRDGRTKTVDVLMCGNGRWGGLGGNIYTNAQGSPLRVKAVSGLEEYSDAARGLKPIFPQEIAISSTGHVLLALDTSRGGAEGRDLLVWGKNYDSELGNGKRSSQATPTTLPTANGERLMLCQQSAKEVKGMDGRVWKRGVWVEQRAAVGPGNSVVYWKIIGSV